MKLALTGDLTVTTAAELKTRILNQLAAGDALEIDTQQVESVDVAGLQVLLAAFRSASGAGIAVHFPQEARGLPVADALRLHGLSEVEWTQEGTRHGKENTGR
jgi:ABC-type transporter Mla MlaB component